MDIHREKTRTNKSQAFTKSMIKSWVTSTLNLLFIKGSCTQFQFSKNSTLCDTFIFYLLFSLNIGIGRSSCFWKCCTKSILLLSTKKRYSLKVFKTPVIVT